MEQSWYFTRGAQQGGPVDWAGLQSLAANGQLAPDDRVWTAGLTEWATAGGVRDLFQPGQAAAVPTDPPFAQVVTQEQLQTRAAAIAAQFPGVPLIDYSAIAGPHLAYAGFLARLGASLIDGIIVAAIGICLLCGFVWWVGDQTVHANMHMFLNVVRAVFVVVGWIYFATMESSSRQATYGKRLLGMKVTDLSGNQISFGRASARHFGKILSQLACMIGYLLMIFTPNNQCLHDMVSGCVVLKRE